MAIAILSPIKPIKAGATDAERRAAFLAHANQLARSNPRHAAFIAREALKCAK